MCGYTKNASQKCLAAIGAICVEWALAESVLAARYIDLVFVHPESEEGAIILAIKTFERSITLDKKRDAFVAAMDLRIPDKAIRKRFSDLLGDVLDAGKKRSDVVHAQWSIPGNKGEMLVYQRRWLDESHQQKTYGEAELLSIRDEIVRSTSELEVFFAAQIAPVLKPIPKPEV